MLRELSPREERREALDRAPGRPSRSSRTRARYSSGVSAAAGGPVRGEHALEPSVRGDDRATRIGFRAEVVERVVEHVASCSASVSSGASALDARAGPRRRTRPRPRRRARPRRRSGSHATLGLVRQALAPRSGVVGKRRLAGERRLAPLVRRLASFQLPEPEYLTAVKKARSEAEDRRSAEGTVPWPPRALIAFRCVSP